MSMVKHKQGEFPALTQQHQAELQALAQLLESEVDYSDIAPLTEEFWKNATPHPYYKSIKAATPDRIEA